LVIFALEISGLRQLCCRFFLSPPDFPSAALAARSLLSACSLSEQRQSKQTIYFLILTSTIGQGNARKSCTINQLHTFLQKQEGGIFSRAKKSAEDWQALQRP
jgi:hypothetical protein